MKPLFWIPIQLMDSEIQILMVKCNGGLLQENQCNTPY